ncbi:flagellar hook assembly protein FlgD [Candidatus Magnetomonas plexicatena]|uniref:flagellar hook assembly protein FlgD n=1 Tax=Candidatus Magnetomonas plexicatena TaxID=2552947 RepID=UPI0011055AF4|nr:flagellar basal body rod modification protein [Nitrospirales bacterium LBB_01]
MNTTSATDSSSSSTSSATSSSSSSTSGALGTSDFLQLFTKQLQYQNPLDPMDSSNFTSQLAQFSSVEALTNIQSGISTLNKYSNSLNNMMASNMIGKYVTMNDGTKGQITGISFSDGVSSLALSDGSTVYMGNVKEISLNSTSSSS